jgi:hypothetical protein
LEFAPPREIAVGRAKLAILRDRFYDPLGKSWDIVLLGARKML